MSCTPCQPTKKIPTCAAEVVVGSIEDLSTDIYIYIKNLTTGYLHRQESTSGPYGLVTLDLSVPDSSFYNPNSTYELWATLANAQIGDRLEITIDEEPETCFELSFEKAFDEMNFAANYDTHVLESDL